jgi:hypothetical protein
MTSRCPSDLALEKLLLDPGRSAARAHADACPRCAARLAEMRRQGEDFLRFVYPATVQAVEEAAAARSPLSRDRWTRWLSPLPALVTAAAILILARPTEPPDGYLGAKGGGALGLTVFVAGGAEARAARDGERVPAAAPLRFRVRVDRPCHLWLASVDGAGQVSRLLPAEGDGGLRLDGRQADLPGGAVLDGLPGPERILAVCAAAPLPWRAVEAAARSVSAGGPAAVRAAGPLPGLPTGTAQASLLLEKAP